MHLETTRDAARDEDEIYGVVPDASVRVLLAAGPHLTCDEMAWCPEAPCSPGSLPERLNGTPEGSSGIVARCAPDAVAEAYRSKNELVFFGSACRGACRRIPLGDSTVSFDATLVGALRPTCSPDAGATPIQVSFARVAERNGGWSVEMRIPQLGVRRMVCGQGYVGGIAREASMEISCVHIESSERVSLEVRDGSLRMTLRADSYDGKYSDLLPPISLPCGASVRWSSFELFDPGWHAVDADVASMRCRHRCDMLPSDEDKERCASSCSPPSSRHGGGR